MSDEEKRDKHIRDYYKLIRKLDQDATLRIRHESNKVERDNRRMEGDVRSLRRERELQSEARRPSEQENHDAISLPDQEYHDDDFKHFQENFHDAMCPPDQEYHDDDFKHFQENFHHYRAAAHASS